MTTTSVLEALAALDACDGWQPVAPTREAFAAHAVAHPYDPEPGWPTFGLWAVRLDDCVGLLEVAATNEGEQGLAFYSVGGVGRSEHGVREVIEDAEGWLALDATGRPLP